MATGVCRSDWHGWKGHDSDVIEHGLPFVPGHEVSGVVTEVGKDVTSLRVGDRVAVPFILSCGSCRECLPPLDRPTVCENQTQPGFTMRGSFAEYLSLPRADRNLSVIPEGVSYVEAAALGCRFTTAYRAVVQRGRIDRAGTVAVFGCGGLGLSCVMIAAADGVGSSAGAGDDRIRICRQKRIIAIDVSESALAKAKELGATDAVDARLGDDHVRARVLALTDGKGVDLTIDAAGTAPTCENAVWTTRRAGRMVQVGLPLGGRRYPIVPMGVVAAREIDIMGSHGLAASDMPDVLQLVAKGFLDPGRLVEREVNFEQGARAIQEMDKGSPLGITMVTSFAEQSRL